MKKIYSASNLMEAQIVLDLLAHAYIPAQIFNQYAQGMAGEIPVHHACPEIWITRDEDFARGKQIIDTYENTPVTTGNVQCPSCGEENPANFQLCWKCGGGLEIVVSHDHHQN
ncbi:MAG: DUF2007 domain-containing protein [Proteobacteria bacterium]|nr:DUF2007 domain-containing protein [Pseudomonadota bacterium]